MRASILAIALVSSMTVANAMAQEPRRSSMHPTFEVVDVTGQSLAHGGVGPDAQRTCGACHDTAHIMSRNTHGPNVPGADCFTCHVDNVDVWTEAAIGEDGKLRQELVTVGPATDRKCAGCHGLLPEPDLPVAIPKDYERPRDAAGIGEPKDLTLATGSVFSGDKIRDSHLNIQDKDLLDYPWDIHANRKLGCVSCHHSANNPARSKTKARELAYLKRDPRIQSISEYIARPDHNLTSDGCVRCHDAAAAHDFLPQRGRHMEVLECQSCHIPRVYGPALTWEDATTVTLEGNPVRAFRGMEGETGPMNGRFTKGFAPDLFQYVDGDGNTRVGPFNLISRWFWVDDDTGERVEPSLVRAAFMDGDRYSAEIVKALDRNGDGELDSDELYLETEEQVDLVTERLIRLGVQRPAIRGEIDARPLFHGVTNGEGVVGECDACHAPVSRLNGPIELSPRLPGSILPSPGDGFLSLGAGDLRNDDGTITWNRRDQQDGLYVFGSSRAPWSDGLGMAIFGLVILVLAGHAAYRFYSRKNRASHSAPTRKVYMYRGYERIWHWLMAASIITLMLTGFEIHYPDTVSVFGFETAVAVHNFVAVVMIINAFLSLFYHLASSDIRQFVPERTGLIKSLLAQVQYYSRGIFLGQPHPVRKDLKRKLNPLQQVTYMGLLNVLFPLQVITGALIWISTRWPEAFERIGGLTFVGPVHNLGSWMFLTFLVVHVYLTTTGHTLFANIGAMVDGYDEIEIEPHEAQLPGETHG